MNFYNTYKNNKCMFSQLRGGGYRCIQIPEDNNRKLCVEYPDDEKNDYDNIKDCTLACHKPEEFARWREFLSELLTLDKENNIYVKGGTVIGIDVLKKLIATNIDDAEKNKLFGDFLRLNLIKDWDFTMIVCTPVKTMADLNEINDCVEKSINKYGIENQGTSMIVLRTKSGRNLKLGDDFLFEMSVKGGESYSSWEIPMTSMKILLTHNNIEHVFALASYFYDYYMGNNAEPNLKDVNRLLDNIAIDGQNIDESGLFDIGGKYNLDTGAMHPDLIDTIKKSTENDNEAQFIISHIIEPDRLFYRLFEKNMVKSGKIKNFFSGFKSADIPLPDWILNDDTIRGIIEKFLSELKTKVQSLCNYDELREKKRKIKSIGDFITYLKQPDPNGKTYDQLPAIYDEFIPQKTSEKISKGYICKMTNNLNNLNKEYADSIKDFFDIFDKFYRRSNLGRLRGNLIKTMTANNLNYVKNMLPIIPDDVLNFFEMDKLKNDKSNFFNFMKEYVKRCEALGIENGVIYAPKRNLKEKPVK